MRTYRSVDFRVPPTLLGYIVIDQLSQVLRGHIRHDHMRRELLRRGRELLVHMPGRSQVREAVPGAVLHPVQAPFDRRQKHNVMKRGKPRSRQKVSDKPRPDDAVIHNGAVFGQSPGGSCGRGDDSRVLHLGRGKPRFDTAAAQKRKKASPSMSALGSYSSTSRAHTVDFPRRAAQ